MLILLPLACWVALILVFIKRKMSRRTAFLSASVIWGVLLTFLTESLSLFDALTRLWIALSWGGAILIILAIFFLIAKKERHPQPISFSRTDVSLTCGIVFLFLTTLATALVAPPNNWDSMTYHMSRVVHWLQNKSVRHYPTHIIRQLELNPWAEFAITHFQALSGGDRFANLIQWFSMVGSVIGATLVAGRLGARHRGQLLAAVLTATIPMGILQASSTQNDYVVAFWLLCFAWSGLRLKEEHNLWWSFMTGASLGLALLTKGTAYLYALPFILWFSYSVVRNAPRRAALLFLGAALPVVLLNGGHYSRNWVLFSNPLTSSGSDGYANEVVTAKTILSNIVRNSTMHLSTPFEEVNHGIEKGVGAFHQLLDMNINDERTTWPGTNFGVSRFILHEDYSGNLLHAILAAVSLVVVAVRRPIRRLFSAITPYTLGVTAAFLIFCSLLKWQPWNVRLHLPLFILGAPISGVVLGHLRRQRLALTAAVLLIFAALPWTLGNMSRPLIPSPKVLVNRLFNGSPVPLTIVTADRQPQYFTNRPQLWRPYSAVASVIKSSGAKNIGLILGEEDWEYPLWALVIDAAGKGPRIEHIDVTNQSETIGLGDFHPDLIVKTNGKGYPTVMWPQKRGGRLNSKNESAN